jgi:hypothetical protein
LRLLRVLLVALLTPVIIKRMAASSGSQPYHLRESMKARASDAYV